MKNAVKMFAWIVGTVFFLAAMPVYADAASGTIKVIQKTIAKAAVKSGKILTPAIRETSEKALTHAVGKYGDDALKIVEKGGLEALDQGAKYGDDFWNLCRYASPNGVRSLAMHADDLMPIAKRLGPDFVDLEGKVPGLGKKLIENFGDDAVHTLKDIPEKDLTKLSGLSTKTNDPAVRKLLLEKYEETNGKILERIKPTQILATGLSAAIIIDAANGGSIIEKTADFVAKPIGIIILVGVGIVVLIFVLKIIRRSFRRRKS